MDSKARSGQKLDLAAGQQTFLQFLMCNIIYTW